MHWIILKLENFHLSIESVILKTYNFKQLILRTLFRVMCLKLALRLKIKNLFVNIIVAC